MTKLGVFLAGFALAAAVAAGAWWFVVRPQIAASEARAAAAERSSARAKRASAGDQGWAEAERRRRLELEGEVSELRRMLTTAAPPAPRNPAGHGPPAAEPGAGLPPAMWDSAQRGREIQLLSLTPRAVITNPRFPYVVEAMRQHLDEDIALCARVLASDLPSEQKSVCATLLAALEDPRGLPPLLAAWSTARDENLRAAVLRGLAGIPGEKQTPILVGVWNDPGSEPILRALAIHGLALRRHDIAIAVAVGGAPGSTPPLRLQALNSLQSEALKGGWKDTSLVAVFGKALRTADGDPQRKLALLTLEGFWSKDSLVDLEAFAEAAGTSDLAARARKAANAIAKGEPRPEGAGVPQQRVGVIPADAAPPESGAPAPTDSDPPK